MDASLSTGIIHQVQCLAELIACATFTFCTESWCVSLSLDDFVRAHIRCSWGYGVGKKRIEIVSFFARTIATSLASGLHRVTVQSSNSTFCYIFFPYGYSSLVSLSFFLLFSCHSNSIPKKRVCFPDVSVIFVIRIFYSNFLFHFQFWCVFFFSFSSRFLLPTVFSLCAFFFLSCQYYSKFIQWNICFWRCQHFHMSLTFTLLLLDMPLCSMLDCAGPFFSLALESVHVRILYFTFSFGFFVCGT